jgi:vancomycin resistance protein YoaR
MINNLSSQKILFVLLLVFFLWPSLCYSKKDDINFNSLEYIGNKELQVLLEKPFYLYSEDKDSPNLFYLQDFLDWEYFLKKDPKYKSEVENPFFCNKGTKSEVYCQMTETFQQKTHYKKTINAFLKESEIKKYLSSLSEKINKDPKNARFKFNDEKKVLEVTRKSQKGITLEIDKSYQKIKESIQNSLEVSYIPLAIKKEDPIISSNDPEKYEIKKIIGTGGSDFTGSTDTRIHNIKTAAARFDGLVLQPKEELSFVKTLGPVEESTGYKEELVIKKNKTVPEFGGGICQVSTTMFRAALNTGLKITERHNHSYPVHYYDPPGTDATVYIPQPDLKIKNTTDNHILIQTETAEKDNSFFIKFYSKKNPYQIEIIGPKVTEKTPEGRIRTKLEQVVKNKEGEKIRSDIFKSFYDNPDNYPSPNDIHTEKPKNWSNKQWEEYYAKFGPMIEKLKKQD